MQDLREPFAPYRTWDDVREYLMKYITKRYPAAATVTVEDVVSEAMAQLIDYWVTTDGALDGHPWRNYARAKFYAERYASAEMRKATRHSEREPLEVDKDWQRGITLASSYDPARQSPEDIVLDQLEAEDNEEKLQKLLADVPEAEWRVWLGDFLSGKGDREVARERDVHQSVVTRQRQRGMRRLQKLAEKHGLTA